MNVPSSIKQLLASASNSQYRVMGVLLITLNPLFWYFWTHLIPQPFESFAGRALVMLLACFLLLDNSPYTKWLPIQNRRFKEIIVWFCNTFFLLWMMFCNGANEVWLATGCMSIMYSFYYYKTNTGVLLTLLGLVSSFLLYLLMAHFIELPKIAEPLQVVIVITYCFLLALIASVLFEINRVTQLNKTLSTLGIIAHELRTPLAAINMLSDVSAVEAENLRNTSNDMAAVARLDRLSISLKKVVHKMNHIIDSQISNSSLMNLSDQVEILDAETCISSVLANFPFNSERERDAVLLDIGESFNFLCSRALFPQVIENLLKNSISSLNKKDQPHGRGDIVFRINVQNNVGRIFVEDKGTGISAIAVPKLFTPFFSTNEERGHGLGLAFCKQVIEKAGGHITLHRNGALGACFLLEFPIVHSQA